MGRQRVYGRAEVISERSLGIPEASGVAPLEGGAFLVVDDAHGAFVCPPDDEPTRLDDSVADPEGVCVSPDGRHAYLLSEHDGSVWRFAIAPGPRLDSGVRLGALPRLSSKKNQGWKGIAVAPAGVCSTQPELIAVHQTGPRRIGIFSLDNLEVRALVRLPKGARKALGELDDVAVAPSGHLLVLSGKTGRIAELTLDGVELELVRLYRVGARKGNVPEGLAFDGQGRLWVATDGKGTARQLALHPS